ncbi:MAG TPA: DeoR/GlpR family DNA-binding transcription regulator [Candidatus Micrarchaeia archaeon]|nr:DeoR/GlpR family DNA-binding transcription regulator [Candidatus Micrarchaeia archaeon]
MLRESAAAPIPMERRLEILAAMRERPLLRADEIADHFGVSGETVRRDFLALEREGLLHRVYGGATRAVPRTLEPPFAERRVQHLERKRAMARLAATLVEPTDTLILDVGTSIAELARQLPSDYHGRVLTTSLEVAVALADRPRVEVLVAGGRVRPGDLACSGPSTIQMLADHFADKAFLGSGGVHPEVGLTDFHVDEVACRRMMIAHAPLRFVLADGSKLGQVAVARVCSLDQLTAVVTDGGADPAIVAALEQQGLAVRVAPLGPDPSGATDRPPPPRAGEGR